MTEIINLSGHDINVFAKYMSIDSTLSDSVPLPEKYGA